MSTTIALIMFLVQTGACSLSTFQINGQDVTVATCPILGPPPPKEAPVITRPPNRDRAS